MSKRELILDDNLMDVNGGQITYTWDGTQGSLGMGGRNPYILLDKAKFIAYYNEHKDTMSDAEIIKGLKAEGIITLP